MMSFISNTTSSFVVLYPMNANLTFYSYKHQIFPMRISHRISSPAFFECNDFETLPPYICIFFKCKDSETLLPYNLTFPILTMGALTGQDFVCLFVCLFVCFCLFDLFCFVLFLYFFGHIVILKPYFLTSLFLLLPESSL